MILLAVDTTGVDCAVALVSVSDGQADVRACRNERIGRGHAERLMPMIEAVMHQAGTRFEQVDRFAATIGPGSFTGLRVGVSAIRGFALTTRRPAVGVTTLEALAEPHLRENQPAWAALAAAIDARHGNVYAQVFSADGTALCAPSAIATSNPKSLPAFDVAVGSGADALAGQSAQAITILSRDTSPDPVMVAKVAARKNPDDARPVPLYLKPPDAAPAPPPLPRQTAQ